MVVLHLPPLPEVTLLNKGARCEKEKTSQTVHQCSIRRQLRPDSCYLEDKRSAEIHYTSCSCEKVNVDTALILVESISPTLAFLVEDSEEFPGLGEVDEGRPYNEKLHPPLELSYGGDEAGRADKIEEGADDVDEKVGS